MRKRLVCPKGHQWESSGAAEQLDPRRPGECPICAASGEDRDIHAAGDNAHSGTLVSPVGGDVGVANSATLAPPEHASELGSGTLGPWPPPPTWPGKEKVDIPGYEILGELGRGGMGVVYKARHLKLNRLVALKMILTGGHAGPTELERFRREAEAVAQLQHPNIIQIHEIGESSGLPFFSLEYVEGGSLSQKLDGTPWPVRQAAQLVEVLARAMEYAHQQGIVHRDLKPANVLVGSGQWTVDSKKVDSGQRTADNRQPEGGWWAADYGERKGFFFTAHYPLSTAHFSSGPQDNGFRLGQAN